MNRLQLPHDHLWYYYNDEDTTEICKYLPLRYFIKSELKNSLLFSLRIPVRQSLFRVIER